MPAQLIADRYEVEREIGRGGMGVVLRARDTRLGRTVALKMVSPYEAHSADSRRRLATEARAASVVTHPGIATVYDFVEHGEESFIVYEFVEGEQLRQRMARQRFTTEEIVDLGVQLAEALGVAHYHGVTHRDLKPENIMLVVGPEGASRAKILDFGLAKIRRPLESASADSRMGTRTAASTAAGLVVGTVNYMAPEQVEGDPADARSDIYALGLVLYELAAGINPFVGRTATSTIANILKLEPPPVAARNAVAPPELDRILRKCLRKRRDERYQSARELRVDLASLLRDLAPQRPGTAPVETAPPAAVTYSPLEIPRWQARLLFFAIQVGYLAMYIVALMKLDAIQELGAYYGVSNLKFSIGPAWSVVLALVILCALCGTAVRLYLISATSFDYRDLGSQYRRLFPAALVLDILWGASPLLMAKALGFGLALVCCVALVYLSFAQRRILYAAYSPHGGRSSAVAPRASL